MQEVTAIKHNGNTIWEKTEPIDYASKYFTITNVGSTTNTIQIHCTGAMASKTYSYSTDGETWTDVMSQTKPTIATLAVGESVMVKSNGANADSRFGYWNYFTGTDYFEASGNIASLCFGDNFNTGSYLTMPDYAYKGLFSTSNGKLFSARNLYFGDYETVSQHGLDGAFYGCTSLTTAPDLSSFTSIGSYGCDAMFMDCQALISAPSLTATSLADNCYSNMFRNCTSLTIAPALPVTTLATYCYNSMFKDCTSITTAPALPATILANGCYYAMFEGCSSLVSPPTISATTLAQSCCAEMFDTCTSLTTPPALLATTIEKQSYENMFYGCSSLVHVPDFRHVTTVKNKGMSYMFKRTAITTSPVLSNIVNVESRGMEYMFNECYSLKTVYAPSLGTWDTDKTYKWMMYTTFDGIMYADSVTAQTIPIGESGVPSGWTITNI